MTGRWASGGNIEIRRKAINGSNGVWRLLECGDDSYC